MARYYAIIDDVIYYIGEYRTINEARKRAEIEADRMKKELFNVITATELREIEEEEGEQEIVDLDELIKAVNTIKSVCNKMGDCDNCPFYDNDDCVMNYPYNWEGYLDDVVCNIDTIYVIPHKVAYESNILNKRPYNNKVYEMKITSVKRDEYGYVLKHSDYCVGYPARDYGRRWFLTREEAEKALAEMGV